MLPRVLERETARLERAQIGNARPRARKQVPAPPSRRPHARRVHRPQRRAASKPFARTTPSLSRPARADNSRHGEARFAGPRHAPRGRGRNRCRACRRSSCAHRQAAIIRFATGRPSTGLISMSMRDPASSMTPVSTRSSVSVVRDHTVAAGAERSGKDQHKPVAPFSRSCERLHVRGGRVGMVEALHQGQGVPGARPATARASAARP